MTISITGHTLSLEQVVRVARNAENVAVDEAALEAMGRTRAIVEEVLAAGTPPTG
jgi:histidine ammonia-lyase